MADQQLNLGTVFSAKVSGAFDRTLGKLKKGLHSITDAQKKVAKSGEKVAEVNKKQGKSYSDLFSRAIRVVAV